MTTTEPALDALDAALRASSAARTEAELGRARHDAERRIAEAREQADASIDRARRDGEVLVDNLLLQERATVRRRTTETVLRAQRAVMTELDRRVRAAVLELRAAPDYPRMVEGLVVRARARLGPDAVVRVDPDGGGGVIAEVAGRRVDYTLLALAERALLELGGAVEGLLR
jgi:vacuolar-type H+-ATPase subunit E/Vma4